MTSTLERIAQLAPEPTSLDGEWSRETLTRIVHSDQPARRRGRRRLVALAAAGGLALGTGVAVAADVDPLALVREQILGFTEQPNTTGNGVGALGDAELVASFERLDGKVFSLWLVPTESGAVCSASAGTQPGRPVTTDQLEYGCGGEVLTHEDPDRHAPLLRSEQLGGFFDELDGPMVYGVAPYEAATSVRVTAGDAVRTLPIRRDSHGFGSALPEAAGLDAVTLTFLDAGGTVLGTRQWVAPRG